MQSLILRHTLYCMLDAISVILSFAFASLIVIILNTPIGQGAIPSFGAEQIAMMLILVPFANLAIGVHDISKDKLDLSSFTSMIFISSFVFIVITLVSCLATKSSPPVIYSFLSLMVFCLLHNGWRLRATFGTFNVATLNWSSKA